MWEIIKPAALKAGDKVGVVAPAGWPDQDSALRAVARLEQMGLCVEVGNSLSRRYGYLAGTDGERAEEIRQMFADDSIKGIFCVRGGYGTGRIADQLDYELIRAHPKVFWGYSDITFLLQSIYQLAGVVTFHGPMLSSDLGLDDVHPLTVQTFQQLFDEQPVIYSEAISPLQMIVPGRVSGPLVGGNLSLITSSLGTPYEIDCQGKILFIEEINEELYKVDGMLNQLRLAGKLEQAAGFLICDFNNCTAGKYQDKESFDLQQLIEDYIASAGKPALGGFKIGHCSPNIAVPVGVIAQLDADERTLAVDSGVSFPEN